MKILSGSAIVMLSAHLLSAQISHNLTIYSPDGVKFTLIANGEQINPAPESRVKMENVEEDYMTVKIIFEDASVSPLEKKFLQIAEPTGDPKPVSTVWTIVKKDGEYKFKFLSRSDKKIQPKETIIIQQSPQDNPDIQISVPGVDIKVDDVAPR